jgi:hypothetical protein
MKTAKILATFALLAGVTAHAVTVSFESGATSAVNQVPPGGSTNSPAPNTAYASLTFNNGGGTVVATGFYWNSGAGTPAWTSTAVRFLSTGPTPYGVGVTENGTNPLVEGSLQEYILLDFGGGTTSVSALKMYLAAGTPTSQFFTYAWLGSGAQPTDGSLTPSTPLTAWSTQPTPTFSAAGSYTFDMSTSGSGRYLLLGATDHGGFSATESKFLVQSVTYTSVADGASTIALLGAAIGALGLVGRRRRL